MDSPQPLRIHFGIDGHLDLVLLNGCPLSTLRSFKLHAKTGEILKTEYGVAGVFPAQTDAPDDALSNQAYPLRISASDDADELRVIYKNRPIGMLKEVFVYLHIQEPTGTIKRQIRLVAHEMLDELRDELLDLGVEIIIEPPPR